MASEMERSRSLHIAIDASNLWSGGAVVHLKSILTELKFFSGRKCHVSVWARPAVLAQLPDHDLVYKRTPFWIGLPFGLQFMWQLLFMWIDLRRYKCDVLFAPGGYLPLFCGRPCVALSQNMLPFEPDEAALFGRFSLMRLKFFLLRQLLKPSFRKADGLVFLTRYAKEAITPWLGRKKAAYQIIPHGIDPVFFRDRSSLMPPIKFCKSRPLNLLYVSPIFPYKHHFEVLEAVETLREKGVHVRMTFVGGPNGNYGKKFVTTMRSRVDAESACQYVGHVEHSNIHDLYHEHDAFVFASSCENLPNILLEAMASGMPIACSCKGPMPDVLGDCGIYFDPYSVSSLVRAIEDVYANFPRHVKLSLEAQERARAYSWKKVCVDTFSFLGTVHDDFSNTRQTPHV